MENTNLFENSKVGRTESLNFDSSFAQFNSSAEKYFSFSKKYQDNKKSSDSNNLKNFFEIFLKNSILSSSSFKNGFSKIKTESVENFLSLFNTIQIIVHQRGVSTAVDHTFKDSNFYVKNINALKFNKIFRQIKKSKQEAFSSHLFPGEILGFNGYFLASNYEFKNFDLILLVSWDSFLQPSSDDIKMFNYFGPIFTIFFIFSYLKCKSLELDSLNFHTFLNFPLGLELKNQFNGFNIKTLEFEKNNSCLINLETLYQHESIILNMDSNLNNEVVAQIFHYQRIVLLGELVNTLKHELSNPIFAIKLASNLLEKESEDIENAEIFQEISRSAKRCLDTLDNFTNIYLASNNNNQLSISEIIDEVLLLTKSVTRLVRKTIIVPPELFSQKVKTNHWALTQVLFNLVINAGQVLNSANIKNPEIKLQVRKNERDCIFIVSDNGPGIDLSLSKRIFDPFFTTKEDGTGLGLAICRGLAQKLGGNLILQNPGNEGAKFMLSIPLGDIS